MEESGYKEIIKALELHSQHIDEKIDTMKTALEKKFDGIRVELTDTQETTDFYPVRLSNMKKSFATPINNRISPYCIIPI